MARPTGVTMTAAAAVVVAAIAGGVAYAATPHTTATATAAPFNAATPAPANPTPASPAPTAPLRRLLAHAEHGEFTTAAATDGAQTLDVQRGVITAVNANSLTVRSTDGYSATYTITPSTAIKHPEGRHHEERHSSFGAPAQTPQGGAAGLQPNESVMVLATKTATGDSAMRIVPDRNVA